MMWTFVCVNTALHPASNLFIMEINELCVSPDMIWPSLAVSRGCGNINVHSLVDINVLPFSRPTVLGGLLAIFCSRGLLGFMLSLPAPLYAIPILGFKVISGFDTTELK